MGALKQKIQGPRDMRVFLLLLGGLLGILAWRLGRKGWPEAEWAVAALGGISLLVGLLRPTLIAPLFPHWMAFGAALGRVMSLVLLTLIYILVFVPYRLLGDLIGRDRLSLRWRKESAPSFWSPTPPPRHGVEGYERQF